MASASFWTKITRGLRSLVQDRRGSQLAMVGFAMIPLLGAVGVAIDTGRAYLIKSDLSAALDRATLAAAHETTEADRQATFRNHFNAAFPDGYLGTHNPVPRLTYNTREKTLHGHAQIDLGTTFTRLLGIDVVDVRSYAVVEAEPMSMELVLVMDNTHSMRHNQSMIRMQAAARGLINALFDNNFDTVNRHDARLTAEGRLETGNLWVSIVPYSATVNIGRGSGDQSWDGTSWQGGTEHFAWLNPVPVVEGLQTPNAPGSSPDAFFQSSYRVEYMGLAPLCERTRSGSCARDADGDTIYQPVQGDPRGWIGCVLARPNGLDQTDTPPSDSATRFTPQIWHSDSDSEPPYDPYRRRSGWDDDYYNNWPQPFSVDHTLPSLKWGARGPNLGCPPAITTLTPDYTAIMDAIDEMVPWPRGGTWSNFGMVWGWRMISPRWRDYLNLNQYSEGRQLPLDYVESDMQKIVVVLTDGENRWSAYDLTAFGYRSEGRPNSEGGLNGATTNSTATAEANARMETICRRMRRGTGSAGDPTIPDAAEDRITVYSIVLQERSQEATFRNCASAPETYFFARDNSQLNQIFEQISENLRRIRLVQ